VLSGLQELRGNALLWTFVLLVLVAPKRSVEGFAREVSRVLSQRLSQMQFVVVCVPGLSCCCFIEVVGSRTFVLVSASMAASVSPHGWFCLVKFLQRFVCEVSLRGLPANCRVCCRGGCRRCSLLAFVCRIMQKLFIVCNAEICCLR
jgi:hypothetical protein